MSGNAAYNIKKSIGKNIRSQIPVTFVLPDRNRNGGVRVTVEFARGLKRKGYPVRILYRRPAFLSRRWIKKLVYKILNNFIRKRSDDWIQHFPGMARSFRHLESEDFAKGEVVFAVGTKSIMSVYQLPDSVEKVRFCHGFPDILDERSRMAWTVPMRTIAVSEALLPRIKELTGNEAEAVIPNGINADDYHIQDTWERDGVGTLFSVHPKKAPEDVIEILRRCGDTWPDIPRYVFSASRKPPAFPATEYHRFPSVEEARRLYNKSIVWIVGSRSEGFGLPILEAMACGCVVVSTHHDTAPGLIEHGKNGFLIPIGDVDGFIETIRMILADPELRSRVVAEGIKTAEKYSWNGPLSVLDEYILNIKNRC